MIIEKVAIQEKRKGKAYLDWRKAVFERDNYTCQHCFERKNKIHAHHVKTWEEAPELRVDLDNGLTLCTRCHGRHHCLGVSPPNKGKKMSDEQRQLLSDIKKGKPIPHINNKGKAPWNKGTKGISTGGFQKGIVFSDEHRKKLSEAASKREITEETRSKLRKRGFSEEHREKLSQKATEQWRRYHRGTAEQITEISKQTGVS